MRAIDRIIKAARANRDSVHVPDWDLDIYFGPVTSRDQQEVYDRMKKVGIDNPFSDIPKMHILTFIQKAEAEDHTRLFEWGDEDNLLRYAPAFVVEKVINRLYEGSTGGIEEAKKNSETTTGSTSESS